jgi:hypothetical protein
MLQWFGPIIFFLSDCTKPRKWAVMHLVGNILVDDSLPNNAAVALPRLRCNISSGDNRHRTFVDNTCNLKMYW